MNTRYLSPRDLYQMRQAQLLARRRALQAQLAEQMARELLLGLERKYGLLGHSAQIDIHSGHISFDRPPDVSGRLPSELTTVTEVDHGPGPDADSPSTGPS